MGLLDWMRGGKSPEPPGPTEAPAARVAQPAFPRDAVPSADSAAILADLFRVPPEQCGAEWDAAYQNHVWDAALEPRDAEARVLSDGRLYRAFALARPGAAETTCVARESDACLREGAGLLLYGALDDPQARCFLTLGQIDAFARYGTVHGDPRDAVPTAADRLAPDADRVEAPLNLVEPNPRGPKVRRRDDGVDMVEETEDHGMIVGDSLAAYLPRHLALSLFRHLNGDWGLREPYVAVIYDKDWTPNRRIVIGLDMDELGPDDVARFGQLFRDLFWHTNPGQRVTMIAGRDYDRKMIPLRQLAGIAPEPRVTRRFDLNPDRPDPIVDGEILRELLAQPASEWTPDWLGLVCDMAWCAAATTSHMPVSTADDGHPYLRLNLHEPGDPTTDCLASLCHYCYSQGAGAALYLSKADGQGNAQLNLSFGLIDSLIRYDSPQGDPMDVWEIGMRGRQGYFERERPYYLDAGLSPATEAMMVGEQVFLEDIVTNERGIMARSELVEVLPPHVARALHRWLTENWGIADPHVALLYEALWRPSRCLAIGLRPGQLPAATAADDLRARLSELHWFLSPTRQVSLVVDDESVDVMTPLSELL